MSQAVTKNSSAVPNTSLNINAKPFIPKTKNPALSSAPMPIQPVYPYNCSPFAYSAFSPFNAHNLYPLGYYPYIRAPQCFTLRAPQTGTPNNLFASSPMLQQNNTSRLEEEKKVEMSQKSVNQPAKNAHNVDLEDTHPSSLRDLLIRLSNLTSSELEISLRTLVGTSIHDEEHDNEIDDEAISISDDLGELEVADNSSDDDDKPLKEEVEAVIQECPSHECENMEDAICAICRENTQKGESVRALTCHHTFHQNCIDTWLKDKLICPVCRHPLMD